MLGLALLGLISLGSAARNWTSTWEGFDRMTMALESVETAPDRSTVTVTASFVNNSTETLQIYELDTGLRLSGRSISAEQQRFTALPLDPGESVTLESTVPISGQERSVLNERLDSGDERWNVEGRVLIAVEGLSEPVWLPYRFDVGVD